MEINTKEILFRTDDAIKEPLPLVRCQNLIDKYFSNKNNEGIFSYRFVEVFINVLADQLVRLSSKSEANIDDENARLGTIVQWNDSSHLIVVFNSQTPDTISALYLKRSEIKTMAISDYNKMAANALLEKLQFLARRSTEKSKCEYTGHSLWRSGMWQANMVEVKFETLNLHAGVKEETIMDFINNAFEKAVNSEILLFFDEINTSQSEAGLKSKVKKYEEKYIQIMVDKELKNLASPVFANLLLASQRFVREVEEPYSVSLRDVKRAITLVKYFYNSLALSLCNHSRLYDQKLRKKYRIEMEKILNLKKDAFSKIIRDEQEDYINRMQCPPTLAKNEALLENVLVMIACILTKIPLFLIGAPGSSKSLAIRLISSNLLGLAETSPYNPLKVLHSLLESSPFRRPTVSVIGISNWRLDISKSSRALLVQ
ncbi:8940_t:CDS:10, partial [Funneliformis geosporum]